uniref:Zebrafish testis-expressed 38 n=1 Tax=Xiphophorus couchianus TaxID=32473 RepID=A0A3B5KYD5_9TELE
VFNEQKSREFHLIILHETGCSLVFVKRMMAIAVSSVTYLRGIFPESAYRSRYLDDLCIKVLRENSNTPGANKVVKWMMGCFDALEKQYFVLFNLQCIIESYQFNFRYTEMGPEMDISRWGRISFCSKASVLLIRKLFLLLQNLDALPSNVYLTMKLYYYDDITPADYQPPGFQEGVHDRLWFQGVPVHFKVGQVHTAFHSLRVRVSVEQGQVKKLNRNGDYATSVFLIPLFCFCVYIFFSLIAHRPCKDACSQTHCCVVGSVQNLLFCFKGQHRHDRTEDFISHTRHVVCAVACVKVKDGQQLYLDNF